MGSLIDDPRLRDQRFVFSDRHDAGRKLATLIQSHPVLKEPLVLAIPAGGVPVGVEIAQALHSPFSLLVVRKIQVPGNTEAGFGAVTFDGHVLINEHLRSVLDLSGEEVDTAIAAARRNVSQRVARYMSGRPFVDPAGKCVVLTDDGLASGYTMLAAVESIRSKNPQRIVVAVPTASASSATRIAHEVDDCLVLNIRRGDRFSVAEAYRDWYDLDDREVLAELQAYQGHHNKSRWRNTMQ